VGREDNGFQHIRKWCAREKESENPRREEVNEAPEAEVNSHETLLGKRGELSSTGMTKVVLEGPSGHPDGKANQRGEWGKGPQLVFAHSGEERFPAQKCDLLKASSLCLPKTLRRTAVVMG